MELPDGRIIEEFYVLEYPDWVNVIAITKDGQFVMERQYRYPVADVLLEIPAGKLDSKSEDRLAAAKRELEEETGYRAANFTSLGCIPQERFEGVLKITLLVFNVARDNTRYTLSVSGQ